MIVNSSSLAALFRGYKRSFERSLNSGQQPMWSQVAQQVTSTGSGEDYGWIGEAPRLRKWIGPRMLRELKAHKYTIDNEPYEGTVKVPRWDIEDDRIGVYDMQAAQLGTATRMWPDDVVFTAFEAGDASVCYDGQFFFDTDHPVGRAEEGTNTTASNLLDDGGAMASHPWYLLDTTQMIKPMIWQLRLVPEFVSYTNLKDVNTFMQAEFLFGVTCRGASGYGLWQCAQRNEGALSRANILTGIGTMNALENDEGRSLGINPNILMVGLSNQFTAVEQVMPGVASTDADGTPNHLQGLRVVVNPLLA